VNNGEKRATIVMPPPDKYGGERKEVRLIPGEPQEIVYENVKPNYCWRIIKMSRNANLVSLCEIDMLEIQKETVEVESLPEETQMERQETPDISGMPSNIRLTEIQLLSSEAQPEESIPERETTEESHVAQDSNHQEYLPSPQVSEESVEEESPPIQPIEQSDLELDERTESTSEDTEGQGEFEPESAGETWEQIQQIHQQAKTLVNEISDVRERVIDLYEEMEEICRSSSRLYKALQRANRRAKQIINEIQHIQDDDQESQAESTPAEMNNEE